MSWYKGFRLQWKEIIETVASDSKRTTQMIEKDTIQSMILNNISQSGISLVFKGGTSLSKAFNVNCFFEKELSHNHQCKATRITKMVLNIRFSKSNTRKSVGRWY